MKLFSLTLFAAALAGCAMDSPTLSATQQHDDGCGPGIDSYTNEDGDEVICVNTEEPAGPCPTPDDCVVTVDPGDPGDPGDPCAAFPELCTPDPTDPCELDPDGCAPPVPDPNGVCPSRTIKREVERWNINRTAAKQRAETDAVNAAEEACTGDWFYLVPPTYCGDGDNEGFTITSSSCVIQKLTGHSEWDCSATAQVTCNYTFHLI